MIVSASRRTDIPAFYTPWLKQRIREGFCISVNPFNPNQRMEISLLPDKLDAFAFWTRNPAPMIDDRTPFSEGTPFFDYLKKHYRFYFLFTITGYPAMIEPGGIALSESIEGFKRLAGRLSTGEWEHRSIGLWEEESPVVWRFDPIFISNVTPISMIKERFHQTAEELQGACTRVITSIYDPYKKAEKKLAQAGVHPASRDELLKSNDFADLITFMKRVTKDNGMTLQSCCEDLSKFGVPCGGCIDAGFINTLFGANIKVKKDPSQRKGCLCSASKDIGAYDTCIRGCRYCYGTRSFEKAGGYFERHYAEAGHKDSPFL